MKKSLFFTTLTLVSLLVFTACSKKKTETVVEETELTIKTAR